MANAFERELGIPQPKCCSLGSCCKGASPSTPFFKLWEKAKDGDEFARGFLSIMVPYKDHEAADKVVPGLMERTRKAAAKSKEFETMDDVAIYHCRYQTEDNKCGVWEDRPAFCRDYPDTPFVVMAPGCAYEPWAAACKDKYNDMKAEVAKLKELKAELARLHDIQNGLAELYPEAAPQAQETLDSLKALTDASLEKLTAEPAVENPATELNDDLPDAEAGHSYTKIDELFCAPDNTENLSLVLSLTKLYVASPLGSVYLVR